MPKQVIYISAKVDAPIDKVWEHYNNPESIKQWNHASDDWHCPSSSNDLRVGGKFKNRMEAKDGSFGFDFEGEYLDIIPLQKISYKMTDDRKVDMSFHEENGYTLILIDFEAEEMNPIDMQKEGWQAILNNFKVFVEQQP